MITRDEDQSFATNVTRQILDPGEVYEVFYVLSVEEDATFVSLKGLWPPSFYGGFQGKLQRYVLAELCIG